MHDMLAKMALVYPAFASVFVDKCDIFLAHSLQMATDTKPTHAPNTSVRVINDFNPPNIGLRVGYCAHTKHCEEVGHSDSGSAEGCGQGGAPLPTHQGRCVHCEESDVIGLPVRSLQYKAFYSFKYPFAFKIHKTFMYIPWK